MDRSKEHVLHNLNQLLDEPGVIGIKTGFTEKSGENLVGLVERENHKVLTVVLGSKDRFGETKALMDWVYSNFDWTE
jgi:D-alanyl-D-alanine carboxypeptidase (penicillin-binding protein 5/6)